MNVFNAIGRVGGDAEVRYTPEQTAVASWSLAVNFGYGKSQNTVWLNCSLFGKRAETLQQYIKKGSQIGVTGEINLREYKNKSGDIKQSLDLVVSNVTLVSNSSEPKEAAKANGYQKQPESVDELEGDIPF
jgi:single-strand DNA-binding protein